MGLRDIALALILLYLASKVLKRPHWGVYTMAWLGYMNPHRLCYGFMREFPVVQSMVFLTLISMYFSKEKFRMVWSREVIILIIMLLWMGITTTQAFYFHLAWEQYIKVLKIQMLTLMTILVLNSRQRIDVLVWVIVLSIGFYGVKGGIFTIMHGGVYRVMGPDGSFIAGNNEIALAFAMTIPLMRYLQLQQNRFLFKLGIGVMMWLTAIAAIGSHSRGALVALLVTGVIFWLKSRNRLVTALFIAVATYTVVNLMPQHWYDRMQTIKTYEEDRSSQGRINAWWTAFNVAQDRITGGGFEMFRYSVFRAYAPDPHMVHDAHSIYFEMLGEHGFIGLGLFLALLGFTWLKCSAIIRRCKRDPEKKWAADLAAMIQVSMVGYGSAGAFLGLAYFDYIYHLVAITVVLASLTLARQTVDLEVTASVRPVSSPGLGAARPAITR
ncbi:MAG: putative O-glycosylation ligase, exosortase A system-associated [Candidatus Hadarchaeum sp.]